MSDDDLGVVNDFDDVDFNDAVNWNDPLCDGLKFWHLRGPWNDGGTRAYDLTSGQVGTRTNMTFPSNSDSGPGTTKRPGGWGEDRFLKTHPDYIQVRNSQVMFNQPAMTIGAWVNPQDSATYYHVYAEDNASGVMLLLRIGNTGKIEFGIYDGAAFPTAIGATTVPPDTWSYIAGCKSGTTLTCWLNGRADGTATFSGYSASAVVSAQIGRITNAGSEFGFFGAIDDVTLSTRALDIAALYQDGRTFHPRMLRRVEAPMRGIVAAAVSDFFPAWGPAPARLPVERRVWAGIEL